MTRVKFERLVTDALKTIPRQFREEMTNITVVVEDRPSAELLDELGITPPDTLYGLYEGTPLPERGWDHGNVLPDRITIFQAPIVEDARTHDGDGGEDESAIVRAIGETVIHEFGHYFGLSEEEIEAIEERYWN